MIDHHIALAQFRRAYGGDTQVPVPVEDMLQRAGVAIHRYGTDHPHAATMEFYRERLSITLYADRGRAMSSAYERLCMARLYGLYLADPIAGRWELARPVTQVDTYWPQEIFSYRFAADLLLPTPQLIDYVATPEFKCSPRPLDLIAGQFDVPRTVAVRQSQRIVHDKNRLLNPALHSKDRRHAARASN